MKDGPRRVARDDGPLAAVRPQKSPTGRSTGSRGEEETGIVVPVQVREGSETFTRDEILTPPRLS